MFARDTEVVVLLVLFMTNSHTDVWAKLASARDLLPGRHVKICVNWRRFNGMICDTGCCVCTPT